MFQRGGYFSAEVIPNSVAVISLNTMYFYDSNAGTASPQFRPLHCILTSNHDNRTAVGGCEHSEPQDPGNLQFDWLDVQLEMFRSRKMQVRLPPASDWLATKLTSPIGLADGTCPSVVSKLLSGMR